MHITLWTPCALQVLKRYITCQHFPWKKAGSLTKSMSCFKSSKTFNSFVICQKQLLFANYLIFSGSVTTLLKNIPKSNILIIIPTFSKEIEYRHTRGITFIFLGWMSPLRWQKLFVSYLTLFGIFCCVILF